jgi:hypothetical protein
MIVLIQEKIHKKNEYNPYATRSREERRFYTIYMSGIRYLRLLTPYPTLRIC